MKRTLLFLLMVLGTAQFLLAGSITGTVNGTPANGLSVEAFELGNPQAGYSAPVENGAYLLSDVDFGSYIIKLSGMGIHIFYDGVNCIEEATPVNVTETTPDVTGIDFNLNAIPQGMILGNVINNNGHGSGPGMVNGTVLLFDQQPVDPSILPIDDTTVMGMMYHFNNLDFGTYYVALEIPDEPTLYYDMVEDPTLASAIILDDNNPVASGIDFEVAGNGLGTAEVNGIVTDNTGSAVAEALVELIPENGNGMHWFHFETLTDTDGSYVITEIPAGNYYLSVQAETYLPYYYDGVTIWQEATLIEIEDEDVITIDPVLEPLVLYSVTGIVLDDEANPLEGIHVAAIQDGMGGNGGMWNNWYTETAIDGTFELEVPSGDYYFAAHLMDWMNSQVQYYDHKENLQEADMVTVNAPVSGIDFDFVVTTYNAVVSGTVTNTDLDAIEGANAFLFPVDPNQWFFAHSITDEFGLYEIDNIPPGDYYLSVNAQYYQSYFYDGVSTWEEATIITISEDDMITIDPVLVPVVMYTVSGTVLDDLGNPMSDVIVFAHSNNWNPGNPGSPGNPGNHGGNGCNGGIGNLNTSPDINGYFELEVPAGEFIFGAETLDLINTQIQFFDHKASPDVADVVLVEDDVTGINFDFTAPAVYDNSISGSITFEGLAIEDAMVVCVSADETFSTATFTNELGLYELANLPENDYYVYALSEGAAPTYYPGVINFEDAIAVTALGVVTGIDFELVPISGNGYLGLNGYVNNGQREPIANAVISILDQFGNVIAVAQTNSEGFYQTNSVIADEVTISANKIFYTTSSTTVIMTNNTSIDFTIEPTSPTGSDDTPVSSSVLSAQNYPNPFNPTTNISFNLPVATKVIVTVYNVKGQTVTKLVDDELEEGLHNVTWNGLDSNNKSVASGVYYYKVKAAKKSVTKKMILLK